MDEVAKTRGIHMHQPVPGKRIIGKSERAGMFPELRRKRRTLDDALAKHSHWLVETERGELEIRIRTEYVIVVHRPSCPGWMPTQRVNKKISRLWYLVNPLSFGHSWSSNSNE
jgi:hypothetical protein